MSEQAGARFVELIADDNFDELKKLFTDDFVFTAATPGDTWQGSGIQNAMAALRDFFSHDEVISEISNFEHHALPGRSRISYQARGIYKQHDSFEYEHQAYYQVKNGKISRLRILCSGFF